jgi:nucleoside-diphosphate-sugar epimerase
MIFVTGGTGLVGSHLLLALLQRGEKVRALKRTSSDISQVRTLFNYYTHDAENLFNQIEWVDGNILDIYSLDDLLEGIETIYHCAAVVSFQKRDRRSMIANNIEGTANLVNAAIRKKVPRICHVSSVSALGKTNHNEPVTENTNWVPGKKNTGYSESKFFSETEIWRGVEEGLDAVIVNPSIIIGPGNWKSGSPAFYRIIGNGMNFYTMGATGYVGIKDVIDAMLLLMHPNNFETAKNQRYLLNSANLSYRDFFTRVAQALNKTEPKICARKIMLAIAWRLVAVYSLLTGRPAQITRETVTSASSIIRFDGSKITKLFGFQYRPISEAIQTTAKIYLASGMKHQ